MFPNQDQVVDRPGIGDDEPQRLESQLFQSVTIPLEVFHGVVFVHAMGLEESIEPVPGSKAQ